MATSSGRWVNYHRADVFLAVDILSEQHGFTFHPELSLHHPMLKRTRQPLHHFFHRLLPPEVHHRDRGVENALPGDEEYTRKYSPIVRSASSALRRRLDVHSGSQTFWSSLTEEASTFLATRHSKVIGKQFTELAQAVNIPVFNSPFVQTVLGKHSVYI